MLNLTAGTAWVFENFQLIFFFGFIAFSIYRNMIRQKTLRQQDDGTYVWIEWHGGVRCSNTDPSAPGGEWDSDEDSDGDGDGGD
ncbi:MAG: hypothetical protein AAGA87_07275 [Pseudomonadota bacterium]